MYEELIDKIAPISSSMLEQTTMWHVGTKGGWPRYLNNVEVDTYVH